MCLTKSKNTVDNRNSHSTFTHKCKIQTRILCKQVYDRVANNVIQIYSIFRQLIFIYLRIGGDLFDDETIGSPTRQFIKGKQKSDSNVSHAPYSRYGRRQSSRMFLPGSRFEFAFSCRKTSYLSLLYSGQEDQVAGELM